MILCLGLDGIVDVDAADRQIVVVDKGVGRGDGPRVECGGDGLIIA